MADEGSQQLHIVVFPWLAFGHMLPFLELSKSLARKGHRVSFISTPRNIHRLPKIPVEIAHLIDFIPFSLPKVEGLPETAEATSDLPFDEGLPLKKAFDGLEQPFTHFIKHLSPKPDWIIQDFMQHWLPPIGTELNVPVVYFNIFPAAFFVFLGTEKLTAKHGLRTIPEKMTVPPPWIPFPSKLAYRPHEARKIIQHLAETENASGVSEPQRVAIIFKACKALAIRTCTEVEPKWLPLLQEISNGELPVIPVGILAPPVPAADTNGEDAVIIEWLNRQRLKSVVYVAFGSEASLSNELILELAHGLELANSPFLWALRRPAGMAGDIEMLLPEGFEERTRGYGLVCKGWVPQLKILGHGSVGSFLTHGGWSSITEGLRFGLPLVLLPISVGQGLNARVMEENGVGIEVERNEEDGSFTRESVAKPLKLIASEEGEAYRNKAEEYRDALANEERQEKYVDDFVQFLKEEKLTNSSDQSH